MSYKVYRYHSDMEESWDDFVRGSRNAHFMFLRAFMEYHAERFIDNSLVFRDDNESIVAVMPANLDGKILVSHGGLTFGGILIGDDIASRSMGLLFEALIEYCRSQGFEKILYKRMPDIYYRYPSQEDLYWLFRFNAKLVRRDVSSAIELIHPLKFKQLRKRSVKKALKAGVLVEKCDDFESFWPVLESVLFSHHDVIPVHNLAEITCLRNNFPDNIKLYIAKRDNEVLAGTVVFETELVAHTQYLASSEMGRTIGALDLVLEKLITRVFSDKRYFNFGISTENQGWILNEGLISQKEGFGARSIVQDFYEVEI